jgi:zinc protease
LPQSRGRPEATVRYLTGTLALGTATQSGLAETLVELMSDGKGVEWLQEYPARLAATTPEDVQAAAAKMLAPASMISVVVGDADLVEPGLALLMEVARR